MNAPTAASCILDDNCVLCKVTTGTTTGVHICATPCQVPDDQPFMEAGLDSLGAVDLRNAMAAQFSVELPASVTFDYPTVPGLARFISSLLLPQPYASYTVMSAEAPTLEIRCTFRLPSQLHCLLSILAISSMLFGVLAQFTMARRESGIGTVTSVVCNAGKRLPVLWLAFLEQA